MIALIDYGAGNLRSVHKALKYVGAEVRIVTRPDEIGDARALVLPGVGAFDDCINALHKQELIEASLKFIKTVSLSVLLANSSIRRGCGSWKSLKSSPFITSL